jgi:hypothetical protein
MNWIVEIFYTAFDLATDQLIYRAIYGDSARIPALFRGEPRVTQGTSKRGKELVTVSLPYVYSFAWKEYSGELVRVFNSQESAEEFLRSLPKQNLWVRLMERNPSQHSAFVRPKP